MTEDEARTKQCCGPRFLALVHMLVDASATFKAAKLTEDQANCVASACMAWRFIPGSGQWSAGDHHREGYCGLAGKP